MYMYTETTSVSSDAVLHVVDIVTYMYMYTETASVSSDAVLSPVYTGRLNRFRIRINLNRIRVNALIRILNRFTQPTSECGLNPGWNRIS